MAEQAVNSVTLAVTGELTSRVFSGLIQRYGKDAATSEKLQRLEMLLIKIHSAVEASEKHTLENSWLLQWRDKLKKPPHRAMRCLLDSHSSPGMPKPAAVPMRTVSKMKQPLLPLLLLLELSVAPSFTRNSLSGIVQGIHSARKMLFARGDHDMERLNKILARLEKLSPDIGEFISLLHLEALPRVPQVRAVSFYMSITTEVHQPTKKMGKMREKRMRIFFSSGCSLFVSLPSEEKMNEMSAQCLEEENSVHLFESKCDPTCPQEEQQGAVLQDRLEAAFFEICKAVELE